MIIAEQKRKENIAEYLLYMYQVEDMIRANKLDLDSIEQTLISKFDVPYEVKRDMREWYKTLIGMMNDEQKETTGHLTILENLSDQMHRDASRDPEPGDRYCLQGGLSIRPKPILKRSECVPDTGRDNDIQVALNGLYGLLILKLKKTPITEETLKAFDTIKELIAELSVQVHGRHKSRYPVKLFYRKYGEAGPPLIIVHGLYGSGDNWVTIARELSDRFEVYVVDQRNHGQSPHSDTHDYPTMRDDLKTFMDAEGIDQAVLIGHSMGAKTIMYFAASWPERVNP